MPVLARKKPPKGDLFCLVEAGGLVLAHPVLDRFAAI
jgi:hypothetical protein